MQSNWIEIKNIFHEFPDYNCFVCSNVHNWGFHLKFFYDPDEDVVLSPINNLREEMAGFPGVLHGGFQGMLLDEIMFWSVYHFNKKLSVTAKMNLTYKKTLHTGSNVLLKGKVLKSSQDKIFKLKAWIENEEGIYTEANGNFVVPPLKNFLETTSAKDVPQKFLDLF